MTTRPRQTLRMIMVFLFLGLFTGACLPQEPLPTLAMLPTDEPTDTPSPTPLTPTATFTPTGPPPTATLTPTPTIPPTADPNAVIFDDLVAKFQSRRITFLAYLTPHTARIQRATLRYTYPSTGETREWEAALPVQTLGEPLRMPLQYSMSVENLPLGEDRVHYTWELITEHGAVIASPERIFKVTEAITAERRDDLPIIDAELSFVSDFPNKAIFTVRLTPDPPIQHARFYFTQNNGILLHDYRVRVPTQNAGEPLTLNFTWNDQLGLQIPWQQFEWWWVFTDRMGKQWRTKPAFNEYADNRFHKWTRTPTRHAVLFTYEQSQAAIDVLVKAADSSIERLEQAFGYKLLYVPRLVIYNHQRDFQAWAPPVLSELFVGMASGEWGGAVVAFYDSLEYTGYAILQHELVHLFQFQSVRQSAPQWWMEGSATYFEQATQENIEQRVRRIVQRYGAPDLGYRVPPYPPDGSGAPWPYYVGMTFVKFLRETYGEEAFAKIHIALARDLRFTDALKLVTGKTLTELSTEWAAWIRASP